MRFKKKFRSSSRKPRSKKMRSGKRIKSMALAEVV